MPIDYDKRAREIFVELFFENWMTAQDFNNFEKKAVKTCNYGTINFARDLANEYKPMSEIDSRLNEVRQKVRI